jgi:redox-sensing transcriptional repressor
MGYSGFEEYGLNILAGFDAKPSTEQTEEGKPILPMEKMESFCAANKVLMGIITVPAEFAQSVCDQMIKSGIKAIWNFAPVYLDVPQGILVQNQNMATSLAVLSVHLQAQIKDKK